MNNIEHEGMERDENGKAAYQNIRPNARADPKWQVDESRVEFR